MATQDDWEDLPDQGLWEDISENPAKVIEEMHPQVSAYDRALIKNLAKSPEVGAQYLSEKYPGLEVKTQNGRQLIRAQGEKDFRVLDPDTGFFSRDFAYDVGDIVGDVGAGVVESAATAKGALLGGLPGAMAAGGAASAGTEWLKQRLGQALGLPQTVDAADVGIAGGLGAALPGVGAGIGRVTKAVGKNITPWIGEKMSGVPRDTIKYLKENLGLIDQMEKTGVSDFAESSAKTIKDTLGSAKQRVGKQLEEVEKGAGEINIAGLKDNVKALIAETEERALRTQAPVDLEALQDLQGIQKKYLMRTEKALEEGPDGVLEEVTRYVDRPDLLSAEDARTLKNQLKDISKTYKVTGGTQSRFADSESAIQKRMSEVFRKGEQDLSKQFGDEAAGLRAEYKNIVQTQKKFNTLTKSEENTYKALSNLRNNQVLLERLQDFEARYGVPILNDAKALEAFKYFGKPASAALSGFGTTSTSRTIPMAVLGGSLGSLAGYQTGAGYSGAAIGGGLGAAAGAALGSPQMLKYFVRQGIRARQLGNKYAPQAYGSGMGAWSALYDRQEKENQK